MVPSCSEEVVKGTAKKHLRTAASILIAVLVGQAIAAVTVGHANAPRANLPLRDSSGPSAVTPGLTDALTRQGLVLPAGPGFDDLQAGYPSVLLDGGVYKMWYFGCHLSYACAIGYATSSDGRTWTKQGIVLSPSLPAESQSVKYPEVRKVRNTYRMWYNGFDGVTDRILEADSPDGQNWTKNGVVLDVGPAGSADSHWVAYPRVVFDGTYHMWYTAVPESPSSIFLATSADGLTWNRKGVVLSRGPSGSLDSSDVGVGSVLRIGELYHMVYVGNSNSKSRLFFAESADGASWVRLGLALDVLPPAENGVGQPNIVALSNGSWAVYYVARAGASDLQIYLAEGPWPSPTAGSSGGNPYLFVFIFLLVGSAAVATVLFLFLLRPSRKRTRP
jgi:predicted GH43/DUF377 family glycosyl hydrolase